MKLRAVQAQRKKNETVKKFFCLERWNECAVLNGTKQPSKRIRKKGNMMILMEGEHTAAQQQQQE